MSNLIKKLYYKLRGYEELSFKNLEGADYLHVNWCFHTICNFQCSYCPEVLHNGKSRGADLDIVFRAVDTIIEQSSKDKFLFEFTGGEMTYYRHFKELMQGLRKRNVQTAIISNGSRDLSWWKEHYHLFDRICLSFHPEFGQMDHFANVVGFLAPKMPIHVNIMMKAENFDELYKFAKKMTIEIKQFTISLQPLFENMDGNIYPYSSSQKQILENPELYPIDAHLVRPHLPKPLNRGDLTKVYKDKSSVVVNAVELITKNENRWKGWKCWAGIESLVIDRDGNIFRGWCLVGGKIGNINEPFTMPTTPVVCEVTQCYCSMDIMTTKRRK